MADRFRLIAVTLPGLFAGEAALIELMLERGIDRVHVRKPGAELSEVRELVGAVAPGLRPRLSVHGFHDLAIEFGTGIHLSGAAPCAPAGFNGTVSRSCHSVGELGADVAYSFLSPVFNSISKPGYEAAFNLATLRVDSRTIALGGVTPERFARLRPSGFGGAAMLGYLWADLNKETIIERIDAAIHYSHY